MSANNVTVDRTDPAITPNAAIQAIVAGYNALVSPIANAVIGSITADLPNTGGRDAGRRSHRRRPARGHPAGGSSAAPRSRS